MGFELKYWHVKEKQKTLGFHFDVSERTVAEA